VNGEGEGRRVIQVVFVLLALVAGAAATVQFAVNAELRGAVDSPILASLSFLVGTVALFAGFLLSRQEILALTALAGAPWWAWAGGFLGAFFVTSSIILTPRLGAANTVSSILAGQIFASILLDHFGLLNLPVHAVTLPRIVGAVLVMIGVIVVFRT
jgi:transporter family-2 protein